MNIVRVVTEAVVDTTNIVKKGLDETCVNILSGSEYYAKDLDKSC